MTTTQFRELSRQRRCPHCRGSNISIYKHPENAQCPVIFCNDCFGYPALCVDHGQTFIAENIRSDIMYCKICGDREMMLNTHPLAYPDM